MKKSKKFGGTIKDWQIHTLSVTKEWLDTVCTEKGLQPMILTGTVVEDKLGRWLPGFHMRSTLIKKIDREKGEVETQNTIYKLEGKEGGDIFKDLGDNVFKIFY